MTALEAYALAKKIAISAVSGIKSLTVSGTTLTIETNDGNTIDMVFPTPADGRGIKKAEIDNNDHLIITYDDDTIEDAGLLPKTNVKVTQLLSSGIKIASIKADGITTDLFAPNGGEGGDFYVIDTLAERPEDLTIDDRKVYYCIQDEKFYLWNGIEWSIINAGGGSVIKEITLTEYEALTPEQKMDGTIYFVIDEAGGGGGSAELTEDLIASVTVGGVSTGKKFDAGESLETIIRNILSPTLYPTFTNPSVSMSATGAKLIEKGGNLNVTFTITFNRGSINPAYGTSGYRSGVATSYTLDGTSQTTNTFVKTITEAKTSYQGSVAYAQGEQPKDSNGGNYDSPLPAGSINTNTISYEFVNAIWANTSNIATIAKLSLVSKSTKQRDMVFPAQTVTNPEVFDIPASWTVTAVQVKNDLSGQYEDASDQFNITDITHDDAGGISTAYKRYTFNMGMATGSRSVRVKWS